MISFHADTQAVRSLYDFIGLNKMSRQDGNSILHAIVYLRNLTAHNCRLWHRKAVINSPVTNAMRELFQEFQLNSDNTTKSNIRSQSIMAHIMALVWVVSEIDDSDEFKNEVFEFLNKNYEYMRGLNKPLY